MEQHGRAPTNPSGTATARPARDRDSPDPPLLTVAELLHHHAQSRGQKIAFSGPGRTVSYADLAARTTRIAGHLAAAGLRHGDRVAIVLGNGVEAVECTLAIVRAGAIGVPLNPRSSLAELTALLEQSRACMIFTDNHRLGTVRAAASGGATIVVVTPNAVLGPVEVEEGKEDDDGKAKGGSEAREQVEPRRYEDLATQDAARPPPDNLGPHQPAWLHYTSGTTGQSKGVLSSQAAWLRAAYHSLPEFRMTAADHLFWPLPLFHSFGHGTCIIATIALGASAHLPGTSPLLDGLLSQPATTVLAGLAPTFHELVTAAEASSRCLPRPRLLFTGGAAASAKLRAQVEEAFGNPLLTRYGCTETCGTIAAVRPGAASSAADSCGPPLPGMEVLVASVEEQTAVADGEEGEIWVRTPSIMLGYDGDLPAPILDGGWYRTGDLGQLTGPDQQLTITGRLKELIIRGGQNIHPAEVERALLTGAGLVDAVVVGVPHELLGEVPAAFVVRGPEGGGEPELPALLAACRALLPDYKVPSRFYEIDAVPRTASGKPRRHLAASLTARPLTLRSLAPEAIEPLVAAEAAGVCDVDQGEEGQLDPNQPLLELGLHSLAAVVLRDRLAGLTGLDLPTTLVFEHPTVTAISIYLRTLLFGGEPAATAQPMREPAGDVNSRVEPIAIVSMACRYPGGIESPEDLWRVVSEGLDMTSEFPTDRGWALDSLYDPDPDKAGTTTVRRGGFIRNPADFDAGLFGVSPREAVATDPQHRLLLETSWELLERGRLAPAAIRGSRTGVFIGRMYGDYSSRWDGTANDLEAHLSLGSAGSLAAGRISYAFGLHGPAMSIDTACSSSLVALHLAAAALRSGDCSLAIAGGVTLMAAPRPFVTFSRQRALASDGRCRSYSADADGTIWSEGVGLLLLEKLSDAQRSGHRVHGIVRSTAVNSDGTSSGLTAPSGPAQEQVIRQALDLAGLTPAEVDVIEGHGTATPLGDPIEVRALIATYGQDRDRVGPVLLGSVKSNLGHTQAAAGVAGVIKMIQSFKHGVAPASIHIGRPSRHVDWESGAVELLTAARPWPRTDRPRRAAVSSFGIGGTNAHVILEEPDKYAGIQSATARAGPEPGPAGPPKSYPFLFSGANEAAMRAQARRHIALLKDRGAVDNKETVDNRELVENTNIAFSLATTRSALEYRGLVPPGDREALISLAEGRPHPDVVVERAMKRRLALLFSGQGGQQPRMTHQLCATFPAFDEAFRAVCKEVNPHLQRPLAEVISDDASDQLDRADFAQVAIFAFQVAMCRLLHSFGISPAYVAGHSIGEVAAAHIAGVFTLADAALLVTARGRLMWDLAGRGAMASIMATYEEVAEVLSDMRSTQDGPAIAAVNSPRSIVVSGASEAVEAVMDIFKRRGRRVTRLQVGHAFHSPLMDPMLDSFNQALRNITFNKPHIPFISTVSGRPADAAQVCSPEYWVRQVRAPVLFFDAVRALEAAGATAFVEVGPSPQLAVHVPKAAPACSEVDRLLNTLGRLHVRGLRVNWPGVFASSGARAVDLPSYPFQHRRYWLDPPPPRISLPANSALGHPILNHAAPVPGTAQIVCYGRLSLETHPWLADHAMDGQVLLPATVFADLALRSGQEVNYATLEELAMVNPLEISPTGHIQVQVMVEPPQADGGRNIEIYSRREDAATHDEWIHHATGTLTVGDDHPRIVASSTARPSDKTVDVAAAYNILAGRGIGYGPSFQCVRRVQRHGQELEAHLQLPRLGIETKGFLLHPALLDSALHARLLEAPATATARLPFLLNNVRVRPSRNMNRTIRARIRELDDGRIGLTLTDDTGLVVAEVGSVTTRIWRPSNINLYRLEWTRLPETTSITPEASEEDVIIRVETARSTTATVVEAVHEKTAELLSQIRHWSAEHGHSGGRVVVVTERATVDDEPDVVAAAVWGLMRSAQQEHGGHLVLVDLDGTTESTAALPVALASKQTLSAVRTGAVMVPRLGNLREDTRGARVATSAMDAGGTVLITGGTGALGSLISRHLAHTYGARHILLASRSGMEAPGARQLYDDLALDGVNVRIESCDVGDRAQLAALVASASPRISLVIHLAGIVDDGPLDSLTAGRVHRVLRPKVDAAWYLHELLPVTFSLVLFSSAAGMLGNPGQASYAAANCFLDALARLRRAQGQPAISLAWGPWQNVNGMAGMIEGRKGPLVPLTDQQGLDLFDAALRTSAEPVLVPIIPRGPVLLTASRGGRAEDTEEELLELSWISQLEPLAPSKRRDTLYQLLHSEISVILGYEDDELLSRNLSELGLDSFTGILLRNRLSVLTDLRLPATVAFDHPGLLELTDYLLSRLALPDPELLPDLDVGRAEQSESSRIQDLAGATDPKPAINDTTSYIKTQTRHTGGLDRTSAAQVPKHFVPKHPVDATQEPGLRLASLYLQLCQAGQLAPAGHLIRIASMTLPTFGPEAGHAHARPPLCLASGSASSPIIICFPPMFPHVEGVSVFDGLVTELAGQFGVFEMLYPITAIPQDFPTLADMHVATIRAEFPNRPILTAGYSAGGLTAHSVAARLGDLAIGVVLIDTYRPAAGDFDFALALATAGNRRAGNAFERIISDNAIASMGAYLNLSARWTEDPSSVPTLFLRSQTRAPQISSCEEWRASWPDASCSIDIPGSHTTILNEDIQTTTNAIRSWLISINAMDVYI